jgi:hypothetical protein
VCETMNTEVDNYIEPFDAVESLIKHAMEN